MDFENRELLGQVSEMLFLIEHEYPNPEKARKLIEDTHGPSFHRKLPYNEMQATFPVIGELLTEWYKRNPVGGISFTFSDETQIMHGAMINAANLQSLLNTLETEYKQSIYNELRKKPISALSLNDINLLLEEDGPGSLSSIIEVLRS